ncbi:MAG: TlpA disulfide reductase family protein [Burkholderiaceae bacterium]
MTTPHPERPASPQELAAAADPARRRWLFAGVASAAVLTGAGLAWWQAQPGEGLDAAASFWGMAFPQPDGGTMAMRTLAGKPLLLNFWATWCPPCIEEMPLLDRFYAENKSKGWQVLGMAVDQAPAVSKFLGHTPVRFPVTLAGMAGVALSRSFGNLEGGLPFTVVLDSAGRIAQRKMGRVSPQDLAQWSHLS